MNIDPEMLRKSMEMFKNMDPEQRKKTMEMASKMRQNGQGMPGVPGMPQVPPQMRQAQVQASVPIQELNDLKDSYDDATDEFDALNFVDADRILNKILERIETMKKKYGAKNLELVKIEKKVRSKLLSLAEKIEDYDEIINHSRACLVLDSDNVRAMYLYSFGLHKQGENRKAFYYINKAKESSSIKQPKSTPFSHLIFS